MSCASSFLPFAVPVAQEPANDPPALFAKHCALCHRVNGSGGPGSDYGPDLSDAGLRFTREQLRESIDLPSKTITPGYELVQLSLTDGTAQLGILAPESAGMVLLRQAGGLVFRYSKDSIRRTEVLPLSPMETIRKDVSESAIEPLVEYLLAQKLPVARQAPAIPPPTPAREIPGGSVLIGCAVVATIVLGVWVMRGMRTRR